MNNIGSADLKLLKEIYKDNFLDAQKKLEKHYPIQYLIGYVEFLNTTIDVNESVLIPRFETELLVEKTLQFLKTKKYKTGIDIGTGSGAIAIALKKNQDIKLDACDISKKALEIARNNAFKNGTEINFFEKNILKEELDQKYDFFISNPPYVRKEEMVSKETKYEPQIALYANHSGLEFYERILYLATIYLNKKGSIIFEIGATQKEEIKKIALHYFPKSKITTLKDYNNFDRFMFIEN